MTSFSKSLFPAVVFRKCITNQHFVGSRSGENPDEFEGWFDDEIKNVKKIIKIRQHMHPKRKIIVI